MFYVPACSAIDMAEEKKRLQEEEEKRRKEGYTTTHICIHCNCEYNIFRYDPHLLNSPVEPSCIKCRLNPGSHLLKNEK